MIKYLRLLVAASFMFASIQTYAQFPDNWYNLDLGKDNVFGISADKAYTDFLKGKPSKQIIVAVIDGGTDAQHEDLKDIIWTNPGEIAGNGIDDDKNGYIDDVHGWDFIGGKDGAVKEDTYEMTRLYAALKKKYDNKDPKSIAKEDKAEYAQYLKVKKDYEAEKTKMSSSYLAYSSIKNAIDTRIKNSGKDSLTLDDLQNVKYENQWDSLAVLNLRSFLKSGKSIKVLQSAIDEGVEYLGNAVNYHLNTEFDPRNIVGDNYEDVSQHYYGNNDVRGPEAEHGTHVAGIIAAERNNNIGINGIADNVRIMVVRVVPDGDERDKDVANAIRYAVDNGAKVINMSFGKAYPHNKKIVDDAVKYAESKDVLLVHAAGNDSKDIDDGGNYPNPYFEGTKERANNWIEVGASTPYDNEKLTASFSNYGKKTVDLFAPGFEINSTIPDSKYKNNSGTSMASPVVAGVAAMVRSYYPDLTADEVKQILVSSVTPVKHKVYVPGKKKKTKLSKLCQSGGVVNAYNAVQLAQKKENEKATANSQH